MKIVWRVSEVPKGPYRSFEFRSWPFASFGHPDGRPAGRIFSVDGQPYHGQYSRADDLGFNIRVAITIVDKLGNWHWRNLVGCWRNINEAKDAVRRFYLAHPEHLPKEAA